VRPSPELFSAEFGGSPISSGSFGVGGLGSRLDDVLFFSPDPDVLSRPFVVGGGDSIGLPFSIRYSYYQIGCCEERTSSITKTTERALRRLSQPILALILVRRLYAFANVPCNPGAGSLSKFGSV